MNSSDFDSPGYEYMRSYKGMESLYQKLITLDYQRDFCPAYNCPPIHKFYFSLPSKNRSEQRLLFSCLCAWLIKDKCQMNFDIVPDEYQEMDVVVNIIIEAVRILVLTEEDSKNHSRDPLSLPVGRLKQGYGPEVIWVMNILADRALELVLETEPSIGTIKVVYYSKHNSERSNEPVTYITIGKPFVGGGLTTRPLGSYQVDDTSLVFGSESSNGKGIKSNDEQKNDFVINQENWHELGEQLQLILAAAYRTDDTDHSNTDNYMCENWTTLLRSANKCRQEIELFTNSFSPNLKDISNRISKQLQSIKAKEDSIQSSLGKHIDEFLAVWRELNKETNRHNSLTYQVQEKTDKFEQYSTTLESINISIQDRIKDLNDKGKLSELERCIAQLRHENIDLRLQEGVLLGIYFKYRLSSTDVE